MTLADYERERATYDFANAITDALLANPAESVITTYGMSGVTYFTMQLQTSHYSTAQELIRAWEELCKANMEEE